MCSSGPTCFHSTWFEISSWDYTTTTRQYFFVCIYHSLIIHYLVNGYLGCCHFWMAWIKLLFKYSHVSSSCIYIILEKYLGIGKTESYAKFVFKFFFTFYFILIFYIQYLIFYFLNFKIFNSYMRSQTWTPLPPPSP